MLFSSFAVEARVARSSHADESVVPGGESRYEPSQTCSGFHGDSILLGGDGGRLWPRCYAACPGSCNYVVAVFSLDRMDGLRIEVRSIYFVDASTRLVRCWSMSLVTCVRTSDSQVFTGNDI